MLTFNGMGFSDIAFAVFAGNLITFAFGWGVWSLHKEGYRAPWSAYGAMLAPLVILMATLWITEGSPPQFDALAPQPSAASSR